MFYDESVFTVSEYIYVLLKLCSQMFQHASMAV